MNSIEITSMSTKGQVVIPSAIRRKLQMKGGSKLIVIQEGENILLKPITKPDTEEFSSLIRMADQICKELDFKETDITSVIKASRRVRANRP